MTDTDGASELDIGHVDNETIYVPPDNATDPHDERLMQMGKTHEDPANDLRDPWFHGEEGQNYLRQQGES